MLEKQQDDDQNRTISKFRISTRSKSQDNFASKNENKINCQQVAKLIRSSNDNNSQFNLRNLIIQDLVDKINLDEKNTLQYYKISEDQQKIRNRRSLIKSQSEINMLKFKKNNLELIRENFKNKIQLQDIFKKFDEFPEKKQFIIKNPLIYANKVKIELDLDDKNAAQNLMLWDKNRKIKCDPMKYVVTLNKPDIQYDSSNDVQQSVLLKLPNSNKNQQIQISKSNDQLYIQSDFAQFLQQFNHFIQAFLDDQSNKLKQQYESININLRSENIETQSAQIHNLIKQKIKSIKAFIDTKLKQNQSYRQINEEIVMQRQNTKKELIELQLKQQKNKNYKYSDPTDQEYEDQLIQILQIQQQKTQYNNQLVEQEQNVIKQAKLDLKGIVMSLHNFMMQNLKIGKDIRKDGLSQIIKEILHNGFQVNIEHLPDYLDLKAKIFMLQKSKLELQIQSQQSAIQSILEIYNNSINTRNSESQKNNKSFMNMNIDASIEKSQILCDNIKALEIQKQQNLFKSSLIFQTQNIEEIQKNNNKKNVEYRQKVLYQLNDFDNFQFLYQIIVLLKLIHINKTLQIIGTKLFTRSCQNTTLNR